MLKRQLKVLLVALGAIAAISTQTPALAQFSEDSIVGVWVGDHEIMVFYEGGLARVVT